MASKNRFSVAIVIGLFAILWSTASFAESSQNLKSQSKRGRDGGQDGVVKVDGAAVYEAANFDSPVIEYLDSGKKTKISRKIYPGIGGLGTFYKIRLRAGVYGFIADTDVAAKGGHSSRDDDDEKPARKETHEAEVKAKPKPEKEPESEHEPTMKEEIEDIKNSFYLNRYLGLGYYSINYTEKFRGSTQNSVTPIYAIKFTGPSGFLGGLPTDITLLFTTSAPSFYSPYANTSGFMAYLDYMPFFTIMERKRFYLYWGAGLMIKYADWTLNLHPPSATGPAVSSEEVDIGADVALGAAVKVTNKLALRLEGKYYWENQRYFGFGGALEYKY